MPETPRFSREAWFPLAAGLAWLWSGTAGGGFAFALSLLPGVLLVASGGSALLWPGDLRIAQFQALGGVVGVILGIPALFALGFGSAVLLAVLSAAAFVAAGTHAAGREPVTEGVPEPVFGLSLGAKVAADEALLATMQVSRPLPTAGELTAIRLEVEEARELFRARGWLEKPESYHAQPLPLDAPRIHRRHVRTRAGRIHFEQLSFDSEYEPHTDEPGRDRWTGYVANRTAHAWVLRHPDDATRPRPWLVCIHGYQMGWPLVDFGAFDPSHLHERLGINLLLPVLPLHGARKMGRRSGDGFLSGNILDTVHAEAQAMWDIRRLLSWVRSQGAPAIGVHGLSLGGYTTALIASLDEGLRCAIPGIPATDFSRLLWRHGPEDQIRGMEDAGFEIAHAAELLRVVSPLALEPKVALEHRAMFGGVADRLVPPDQVRDLWLHWSRPEIVWYQGAHLTFNLDPRVRALVDSVLARSGISAA